jgi:hypothetical protein
MWVGPDSDSPPAPYKNPGDGPPSEKLKGSFPPPIDDVKSAK